MEISIASMSNFTDWLNKAGRRLFWRDGGLLRSPFAAVPVLWLLCMGFATGPLVLQFTYFLVPAAIWLGAEHGRSGRVALLLGTLPLLVELSFGGVQSSAAYSTPGLFFVLQLLARFAGDQNFRRMCFSANVVTGLQLLFIFVTLAIIPGFYFGYSGINITLVLDFREYVVIIFFFVGMSKINTLRVLKPLTITVVVSIALQSLTSQYMPLQYYIFRLFFSYASIQILLTCVVFLFIGRVFRRAWMRRGEVDQDLTTRLCLAVAAMTLLTSLRFRYKMTWDTVAFTISQTVGSVWSVAILLFAAGFFGGKRGAVLATLAWFIVKFVVPLVLFGSFLDGSLSAADTMLQYVWESGSLEWSPPFHLVDISYAGTRNWSFGGLDPIFAFVGVGVASRIKRRRRVSGVGRTRNLPPLGLNSVKSAYFFVALACIAYVVVGFMLSVIRVLMESAS